MGSYHVPEWALQENLHVGKVTDVVRSVHNDGTKGVLKILKTSNIQDLRQFRREYDIAKRLNSSFVIRCIDFFTAPHCQAIVFDDDNSVALSNVIPPDGFPVAKFLDIAVQIVQGLQHVHDNRVTHKDIKPSNLIMNPRTGAVKIIDFSIASVLKEEAQIAGHNRRQKGTLSYISPEQTGRMNRTLDYRTDFYSLGITFYQLLTGRLPFTQTEPTAIIHFHLAVTPTPLNIVKPSVPVMLSNIIGKLVMKMAEDRYQNAAGLLWDLKHLDTESEFELGLHDVAERVTLSQKLYGRETEIQALVDSYTQVCETGTPRVLTVTGYSGIGKSVLVNEIYKKTALTNGRVLMGKFEQMSKTIAYSAITEAFDGFIQQIANKNEGSIDLWRPKFLEALGASAQLIVDMFPKLEKIIGQQPPVPPLDAIASKNRFEAVIQKFFQVFVEKDHPLVLFIDDWQWADSASLELLKKMVLNPDIRYFLLIGAYRSNEIDESHPVVSTIEDINSAGVPVQPITLSSLDSLTIQRWISDSLNSSLEEVKQLADQVYRNTQGNPFFVKMYLRSLLDEKLLVFDEDQRWRWDADKIYKSQMMDSVVDFLVSKMSQLPQTTQEVLAFASCMGNHFNMDDLALVMDKPRDTIASECHTICDAGMAYFVEEVVYFAHDRVEEAAYSLLPSEKKVSTHLLIARLFLKHYPLEEHPEKLFDIVDHYNSGSALITDESERMNLVQLNLKAGKRAKLSVAYNSALAYIVSSISYLDEATAWEEHYELIFELYKHRVELEYLNENFTTSEEIGLQVLKNAKTPVHQAQVYLLLLLPKTLVGLHGQCIQYGRTALALLGYRVPENESEYEAETAKQEEGINEMMKKYGEVANIYQAQEMSDPVERAASKILAGLLAPTFVFDPPLYRLLLPMAVNHTLKYGLTSDAALTLTFYGGLLTGKVSTARMGFEFGLLAMRLADRDGRPNDMCKIYHAVSQLIYHWFKPLREFEPIAAKSTRYGLECGEAQFTGYTAYAVATHKFEMGTNFTDLLGEITRGLDYCKKNKNALGTHAIEIVIWFVKTMSGQDHTQEEARLDEELNREDLYGLCWLRGLQAQKEFYLNDMQAALSHTEHCRKLLPYIVSHYMLARSIFFDSLILIACHPQACSQDRAAYRTQINENLTNLKAWSENCPENFQHLVELVEAEMARLEGDDWKASRLYASSIANADKNFFPQDKALAEEMLGTFWENHGEHKYASIHIAEAMKGYSLWGAHAKVKQLRHNFRDLLSTQIPESAPTAAANVAANTTTSHLNSALMDMQSVVRASQTISSDIDMSKLLFNMMKIIIETAGAQKGALLLLHDGKLVVDAEYTVSGQIRVLEEASKHWRGAFNVIEHVQETRNLVVLGRAYEDKQFGGDPYISEAKLKSILCIPITKHDELKGVLYVENNLATFAFQNNRVAVLTVLTSQMAISIENSRLVHHQLEVQKNIAEQKSRAQEAEKFKKKLEEFIDTICHEMRNPLNGIYGGATLLKDQLNIISAVANEVPPTLADRMREPLSIALDNLDSITKCAQQQKVIVDDVLDLSRLESNKIELTATPFQTRTVVSTVLQMLSPQIAQSKLDVILNLQDEEAWISADVHRLSQILINIVSNAVKFTKQGYIEIKSRLTDVRDSNITAMYIEVQDTGIGMSEEEKGKLFERFAQATKYINSQYGGSGLGLAISQKLIERMGGSIQVDSRKWFGSRFSFSIKCVRVEKPEDIVIEEAGQEDYTPKKSTTILVVEDNAVNQRVLLNYCKQKGFICNLASNGLEALNLFETMKYDLVLMDIEMPIINGIEASIKIREMEKAQGRKRTPIIGLSGNARAQQIEDGKAAGMDDYLTKPFHREEIYQAVAKYTHRNDLSPSPRSARGSISEPNPPNVPYGDSLRPSKLLPAVKSLSTDSMTVNPATLQRIPSPSTGVTVRLFSRRIEDAKTVHVAGDFNNWLKDSAGNFVFDEDSRWYEMKRCGDDVWKVSLPMPSGVENYHYVVNRGERIVSATDLKKIEEVSVVATSPAVSRRVSIG
eukprot:TRINITY_DN3962_c0_g1_i3.p1 TRINITY_DN3962_c0_g1~~TRINITY_DN3962_c0_g1_i3.p1  ORF type:complete len:2038 (-),score=502.37 TRINITY_DN3962_c0_g1_i3:121-6234(-)